MASARRRHPRPRFPTLDGVLTALGRSASRPHVPPPDAALLRGRARSGKRQKPDPVRSGGVEITGIRVAPRSRQGPTLPLQERCNGDTCESSPSGRRPENRATGCARRPRGAVAAGRHFGIRRRRRDGAWHGSLFALDDGRVLEGPSTYPQACFDVRIRGEHIEVRARGRGRRRHAARRGSYFALPAIGGSGSPPERNCPYPGFCSSTP